MCNERFEIENQDLETVSYAVTDSDGKTVYSVEDDGRTLVFNVVESVLESASKAGNLTDVIIDFVKSNSPEFSRTVSSVILKCDKTNEELLVIDVERLVQFFPYLDTLLLNDVFQLINIEVDVYIFYPFDFGELILSFNRNTDSKFDNDLWRHLWILDSEWASFFSEVLRDYDRKPEEHLPEFDKNAPAQGGALDDLFRIYLFGWYDKSYTFDGESAFIADSYKDIEKAIKMIPGRFKNCYPHEIGEKLFWDSQHLVNEKQPNYDAFRRVLLETEKLFPGALQGYSSMLDYHGCGLNAALKDKIGDLII